MDYEYGSFEWDVDKERTNVAKHGIAFLLAAEAFRDPARRILADSKHSSSEPRFFCLGKVGDVVITVRFVYRRDKIRIIGAGCWRKGVRLYEKKD